MKKIILIITVLFLIVVVAILNNQSFIGKSETTKVNTDKAETTVISSSKYDDINVKTVELRENESRSLLNVAYPVTENSKINKTIEAISQEFIDSFTVVANDQEQLYQDYLNETGTKSYTTVADFTQHFDVSFANETYVSFVFDRYENTGGTGANSIFAKVFNRITGEEIFLRELFTGDNYLEKLSLLSRKQLYKKAEETSKTLDGTKEAIAEYLESNKESINNGTEPTTENFDGLVISDDGVLTIYFDKYQVAAGSEGIVSIEIPLKDISELLSPTVRDVFSIQKPTNEIAPLVQQQISSVDCDVAKCVALTFDDGPSLYTGTLLDTLAQNQVPATFFVLGRSAKIQPDSITRIVAEGHELGNHTWDHKDLRTLSGLDIAAQLQKTDDLLYSIVGLKPKNVRPPYGAYNNEVLKHINRPIILWSVDPEDWKKPTQEELIKRMTSLKSGGIILAHDIHQSTVKVIPEVIYELKKQGFTFVTVSNILRQPLKPGVSYSHRYFKVKKYFL